MQLDDYRSIEHELRRVNDRARKYVYHDAMEIRADLNIMRQNLKSLTPKAKHLERTDKVYYGLISKADNGSNPSRGETYGSVRTNVVVKWDEVGGWIICAVRRTHGRYPDNHMFMHRETAAKLFDTYCMNNHILASPLIDDNPLHGHDTFPNVEKLINDVNNGALNRGLYCDVTQVNKDFEHVIDLTKDHGMPYWMRNSGMIVVFPSLLSEPPRKGRHYNLVTAVFHHGNLHVVRMTRERGVRPPVKYTYSAEYGGNYKGAFYSNKFISFIN